MINLFGSLSFIFLIILLGFLLRKIPAIKDLIWDQAERINYYILFPSLLFTSLAVAPLNDPNLLDLLNALLMTLAMVFIALILAKKIWSIETNKFGVITQSLIRHNTFIGLAAISSLYSTEGLLIASVVLAILVPTVNVLSVMSFRLEKGFTVNSLFYPIIKNPLILACVAGIGFNLSTLEMNADVDNLLHVLAKISLPLGLLTVGGALKVKELQSQYFSLFSISLIRLVAMPFIAFLIANLFNLPKLETAIIVIFFGLPTAISSYVLTRQFNGDYHLMAGIITAQTIISSVTLVIVLALVDLIH